METSSPMELHQESGIRAGVAHGLCVLIVLRQRKAQGEEHHHNYFYSSIQETCRGISLLCHLWVYYYQL